MSGLLYSEKKNAVTPGVHSDYIDELLTTAECADYLKLSQRTIWRWCKSGRLPAVKVGHQWRIPLRNLENFIY